MVSIIKAVLVSIISAVVLILLVQLVFFFPFYMTVVAETTNLATYAANDNYVREIYYNQSSDKLKSLPIFNKAPERITVSAQTSREVNGVPMTNFNAIGRTIDEPNYETSTLKPYFQRGGTVTVTVSAVYPLEMTLWGRRITREVPVSHSVTVIGLKHYKDLDYD